MDKQIVRWKKIAADCDHSKLTETINGYAVCFCSKLSDVIRTRLNLTSSEFSEAIQLHTLANITDEQIEEMASFLATVGGDK